MASNRNKRTWKDNRKKGPNYKTGDFFRFNPKRYKGAKLKINYRSSYELKFMHQLEANPNVLWWKFENIIIPYTIRHGVNVKRHNYIMDFQVKMKNGDMFLCEVKPDSKSPKTEAEMRISEDHKRNAHKWKAALLWCKHNNHVFKIITEKHLGIKLK